MSGGRALLPGRPRRRCLVAEPAGARRVGADGGFEGELTDLVAREGTPTSSSLMATVPCPSSSPGDASAETHPPRAGKPIPRSRQRWRSPQASHPRTLDAVRRWLLPTAWSVWRCRELRSAVRAMQPPRPRRRLRRPRARCATGCETPAESRSGRQLRGSLGPGRCPRAQEPICQELCAFFFGDIARGHLGLDDADEAGQGQSLDDEGPAAMNRAIESSSARIGACVEMVCAAASVIAPRMPAHDDAALAAPAARSRSSPGRIRAWRCGARRLRRRR